MSYYYIEKEGKVVAVTADPYALADFGKVSEIKWSETFPGEPTGLEEREFEGPTQRVRGTVRPRIDLLKAGFWLG